jgi:hypothetical protein
MYINTNLEDILKAIDSYDLILVANNTVEIENLLIQDIKRTINDKEYSFIALKNIKVREGYRNKGIFKQVLSKLESFNKNIIIYDIISDIILDYCKRNNYIEFIDIKNNQQIECRYKSCY